MPGRVRGGSCAIIRLNYPRWPRHTNRPASRPTRHSLRRHWSFSAARSPWIPTLSPAERRERLARLARMLRKNAAGIRDAISADFGMRSAEETELLEQFTSLEGIAHARRNLRGWMRAERRPVAWWSLPGSARLLRQPLGVVGIIVPWNYPLYLAVSPLTAALAAGNRAMLKMSEHTPRFSALFESLVAEGISRRRDRRRQRRRGGGPGLRRPALRPPAVHRLDRRRPRGDEGGERQPDAGDARARRQVAGHRDGQLRHRGIRAPHHVRQADQRRADLRRAGLRAGAGRRW